MGGLSEIVDIFGQQNMLSGIQEAAKSYGESGLLDPKTAQLIQNSPRLGLEIIPQLMQQSAQMTALGQLNGQSANSNSQPSSLQQYVGFGDSSPNLTVPQGLPNTQTAADSQQPIQQAQPAQQQSNGMPQGLALLRYASVLGRGNIEAGLKALEAQKTLTAIPVGAAPPPEGQQYVNGQLQMVPGAITGADKEVDKNFADAWQTYNNAGGAQRTRQSLDVIDQTINALKKGTITTGGPVDRMAMEHGEPTATGQLFDAPVLVARNQIASAILPQAKALFGSRVTNFDAQSIVNSKGLDPMADTNTNIEKLQRLKTEIQSGQQDIQNSGNYFQQHNTLHGYQNPSPASSNITGQPSGVDPLLLDALKRRGLHGG